MLKKAYRTIKQTPCFFVLFCFLYAEGSCQVAFSDTCTYEGIRLHKLYNSSCKKLFEEIREKNKKILFCGYKKRKKSMTTGIIVQIADSSEIQVYFKSAIYDPLEGSACGNKRIKTSIIDYFVISYFNGSKRIISQGMKPGENN